MGGDKLTRACIGKSSSHVIKSVTAHDHSGMTALLAMFLSFAGFLDGPTSNKSALSCPWLWRLDPLFDHP